MTTFMYNGKFVSSPTREEMIEQVDSIFKLVERERSISEELRKRLEEKQGDEVKRLKEEIRELRMNSVYTLSEKDRRSISDIYRRHREDKCGKRHYHYEVHPTGIESVLYFVCDCGYKEAVEKGL